MTRQEALEALSSSSAHDRLKAVRFLGRNSHPSDLQTLRSALRSETVSYVRAGLELAIKRVSQSVVPEDETTLEEFEVPPDVRNHIRSNITKEITGLILHEIAAPVGLIASASAREVADYEHSRTRIMSKI